MKKYELDKNDSIEVNGHPLYRVVYTDEFISAYKEKYNLTIEKKGGYIESESNLLQNDYAVVLDNAVIYGNAKVFGNAMVYWGADVSDDAEVYDNAEVFGKSKIYGNAKVHDNAEVFGKSKIYGDAEVSGEVMNVSISCN